MQSRHFLQGLVRNEESKFQLPIYCVSSETNNKMMPAYMTIATKQHNNYLYIVTLGRTTTEGLPAAIYIHHHTYANIAITVKPPKISYHAMQAEYVLKMSTESPLSAKNRNRI